MNFFEKDVQTELEKVLKNYFDICQKLEYEEVIADKNLAIKLSKEKASLEPIVEKYQKLVEISKQFQNLSKEEQEILKVELEQNLATQNTLQKEIETLIKNLNSSFDQIVLEFSNLDSSPECERFLNDILLSYKNFCNINGFDFVATHSKRTSSAKICGANAKECFKTEIGVHTAVFENTTKDIFVFVFDDVACEEFDEKDVKIDVYRSNGAGGQNVNKVSTAIRATHTKTGLVCICQDERSQFQNKLRALENLKQKVENFYAKKEENRLNLQRKTQLKSINSKDKTRICDYKNGVVFAKGKQKKLVDFLNGYIE
jgi:peptide chain release factor 1